MQEDREHNRKSIRLKGYDYSQPGAYFVTVVTWNRLPLFGEIIHGEMHLSPPGWIVVDEWRKTADLRPEIELGEFVVMPNHIHGILIIHELNTSLARVGAMRRIAPTNPRGAPAGSIGAIIGQIKSITTKRINTLRSTPGQPVWQRNYYEHIIRNKEEWAQIHRYIEANPMQWAEDAENPDQDARQPR